MLVPTPSCAPACHVPLPLQVVTHLYYSAEKPSLRLWFANCFKMGLIASLLADAAKLGS